MNFYSYNPRNNMTYHETAADAKAAAEEETRNVHNHPEFYLYPSCIKEITWGEVTERAAVTGEVGYTLKRQDLLSYEAEFPQVIDGKMHDSQGNLILLKNIRETDLLYHQLVLQVAVIGMGLSGKIQRYKQHNFEDVATVLDLLYEKHKVERGGTEGNMTFFTFDRKFKLQIAIQKTIGFGPELQIAKAKIDQALAQMDSGGDSDIKTIATAAFTLVDGKLNVAAILRLRSLEIKNEQWNEGMRIIDTAIVVISRKKQIRLYRANDEGAYIPIPLDIAAL